MGISQITTLPIRDLISLFPLLMITITCVSENKKKLESTSFFIFALVY